jgi:NADH-quinone oxidoreductase subunit F
MFIPGGASAPWFFPEQVDLPLEGRPVGAAGSMLGSGAIVVMDDTTDAVRACLRIVRFFARESCGKCTPCREGTFWLEQMLERFEHGTAIEADIDTVDEICKQIAGRSFCALGDAAATPYAPALKNFRDEFLAGTHTPAAELFDPVASTVFAGAAAR